MYYLVYVDHNGMAGHLTRSNCEVLRSVVYPVQCRLMMTCCGMAVKRTGMLEVGVRKMKILTVKMETVIIISKGRENLTCFVY
jgi:hypothetical protein